MKVYTYQAFPEAMRDLLGWAKAQNLPTVILGDKVWLSVPNGKPDLPRMDDGKIADWGVAVPWGKVPPVYWMAPIEVGMGMQSKLDSLRKVWEN